jgi:hypothetical protein
MGSKVPPLLALLCQNQSLTQFDIFHINYVHITHFGFRLSEHTKLVEMVENFIAQAITSQKRRPDPQAGVSLRISECAMEITIHPA